MATSTTRAGLTKPAAGDLVSAFTAAQGTSQDALDVLLLLYKGAWSGATAYVAHDVVLSNNALFVCISAHTNHVPPNGTYWAPNGTFAPASQVAGSVTATKVANYTAVPGQMVPCDTSGGAFTLTLGDGTEVAGDRAGFKIVGTGNVLTVTPRSGNIDGDASILAGLTAQKSRTLEFDGTNWKAVEMFGNTVVIWTANASFTVPKTGTYRVRAIGGGSGGGGGGAAALTAGTSTQVGGAGGGTGAYSEWLGVLTEGVVLTVTIGAATSNASGGTASSDTSGHAGSPGGAGNNTTITGTGISVTAQGATVGGAAGAANSTATVAGGNYGQTAGAGSPTSGTSPGFGGPALSTRGNSGGSGFGLSGGGGQGGAPATASLGGTGGACGQANALSQTANLNTGTQGTFTGSVGSDAAANSGAGGGGGGGGAPGGAGGNGGKGGSGWASIEQVA